MSIMVEEAEHSEESFEIGSTLLEITVMKESGTFIYRLYIAEVE